MALASLVKAARRNTSDKIQYPPVPLKILPEEERSEIEAEADGKSDR